MPHGEAPGRRRQTARADASGPRRAVASTGACATASADQRSAGNCGGPAHFVGRTGAWTWWKARAKGCRVLHTADVVIIGAGIIGCATARALARRGAGRVVVIDRGEPGAEASNAAAGLLSLASGRDSRGALFELKRAGMALYPALVEELRAETAIDVEYGGAPLAELAFTSREAERLDRFAQRRIDQGFAIERLDGDAVRQAYPEVNPAVRLGVRFHDERTINNGRLVEALHAAAVKSGVEFRLGAPVRRIGLDGRRVVRLEVGGDDFSPGHVVVAAGAWSAEIGEMLGVPIPVRGDRGEMFALKPRAALRQPLVWRDGYLVPRPNGDVLIGATTARGAMEKAVTARNAALLLGRAVRMVPSLGSAPVVRVWSGIRPWSLLGRPIIGPVAGLQNVAVACGHHRNGILLAPVTAQLIAELIMDRATSVPIQPFCHRPY
ncbi:MAG: NAD(P)/FAD-dependent oxidoreductase [Candidatus Binatia bacterium]